MTVHIFGRREKSPMQYTKRIHWLNTCIVTFVKILLIIGISAILLQGCIGVNRLHLIVPDSYQGFLVIRFQCPYGVPVYRQFGITEIRFRADGTACLAEPFETVITSPWIIESVQTTSGAVTIPWVTNLESAQGWGLVDGSSTSILDPNGQVLARFAEYWVGDMSDLRELVSDRRYTEMRADFYAKYIGAQRDGTFIDLMATPTP